MHGPRHAAIVLLVWSLVAPIAGAGCDCCEANPEQIGCSDSDCESLVCAAMPSCCTFPWNAPCAAIAVDQCDGCTDADEDGVRLCDGDCDDRIPACDTTDCNQDCDANGTPDACDLEAHFAPIVIGAALSPLPWAADFDGDGDNDLLLDRSPTGESAIAFNLDGLGSFSALQDTPAYSTFSVGDVDADGDNDLIAISIHEAVWFENLDGQGTFGTEQSIASEEYCANEVDCEDYAYFIGDADGDGDPDLFVAEAWFPSVGDPTGYFWWRENRMSEGQGWVYGGQIANAWVDWISTVDLDGDQDHDLLLQQSTNSVDALYWKENLDGDFEQISTHFIDSFTAPGPAFGGSADLDGDGDRDVFAGSSWYENLDGLGDFGPAQGSFDAGPPRYAADLDCDGDNDLLALDHWYENLDGAGTFSAGYPYDLDHATFTTYHTVPAILDGDGDVDLISTQLRSGVKVAVWYDNLHADCNQNAVPDGCEDPGVETACTDVDLDGFGADVDCNDFDPLTHPGAAEVCDLADNDCDDDVDEGLDADLDGFTPCAGDCDDGQANVYPGAPHTCDGLNNDCDHPGWPDVGGTNDGDDDGDGYSECSGDCDDADPDIHAGAVEINDGKDNNCPGELGYGMIDEIFGPVSFLQKHRFFWSSQPGGTSYQVARGDDSGFALGCTVFPTTTGIFVDDHDEPAGGELFHYLVRSLTPNPGSWGPDSAGGERSVSCAP